MIVRDYRSCLLLFALCSVLAGCSAENPAYRIVPDEIDASSPCAADSDCPASAPRCSLPDRVCVGCIADEHCAAGQRCDSARRECVVGCEGRCGTGYVCEGDAGACVECLADRDCKDPARPLCDPSRTCVVCQPDPGKDRCARGTYCVEDDQSGFRCVRGCRTDADCPLAGGGPAPDGGVPPADLRRCDVATRACVECVDDSHCSGDHVCSGNRCLTGCSDVRPCEGSALCCTGACVDQATNRAHCGGCGLACSANHVIGSACDARLCIGACQSGWGDCNGDFQSDGCETAIRMDPRHCGACRRACSSNHVVQLGCSSGDCTGDCEPGWGDCNANRLSDGCEAPLDADPAHCGGCGMACSSNHITPACAAGACVGAACEPGYADCNGDKRTDGCESDLSADAANCGGCGMACSSSHVTPACAMGDCAAGACAAGWDDCNGDKRTDGCERDVRANPINCGACNRVCSPRNIVALSCTNGVCDGACNPGTADCNGDKATDGCETITFNTLAHCGGCGLACSSNHVTPACQAGSCQSGACQAGFSDCNGNKQVDGCESNLANDTMNCGACGVVCTAPPGATPACNAGQCVIFGCASGTADCDGTFVNGCEIDTRTDPRHCGGCNLACPPLANSAPACSGACMLGACSPGYANCDGKVATGCESDIRISTAHCGACGKSCPILPNATTACRAGACAIGACKAGYADCDGDWKNGCEVDTRTSLVHCGACNVACTANNGVAACTAGVCALTSCNAGYADCDQRYATGCEIDTRTDARHCGGCNLGCATGVCGNAIAATMAANPGPLWDWNGNASHDAAAGAAALTQPEADKRGSVFYVNPVVVDTFTAAFDLRVRDPRNGNDGDGMTFTIQRNGSGALGDGGGGLGALGLDGYAVEFDSYRNALGGCEEINANHAGIDRLSECGINDVPTTLRAADLPFALRSGWHSCRVTFDRGTVSLACDNLPIITNHVIANFQSGQTYHFGFTAATGGFWNRHEVRNVNISFPTPRCL